MPFELQRRVSKGTNIVPITFKLTCASAWERNTADSPGSRQLLHTATPIRIRSGSDVRNACERDECRCR